MDDTLHRINKWYNTATVDPGEKELSLQTAHHLEKIIDMLSTLSPRIPETNERLLDCNIALQRLADHIRAEQHNLCVIPDNVDAYIQSVADQIVSIVGCANVVSEHIDPVLDALKLSSPIV